MPQLVCKIQTDIGQSQLQRIPEELCDKKIQGWWEDKTRPVGKVSTYKVMDSRLLWHWSRILQL